MLVSNTARLVSSRAASMAAPRSAGKAMQTVTSRQLARPATSARLFTNNASSAGAAASLKASPVIAGVAATAVAAWFLMEDEKRRTSVASCEAAADIEAKFSTYWPRNILILFGPPGAGKGTHGPKIEEMLNMPQLSTGDMLRAAVSAKSPIGLKAKAVMAAGGLVSDDIVVGIIRDRIKEEDCKFGFILDGFPRTIVQAKALDAMLAEEGACVTKVIELEVPDEVLEERICGRWIHKKSGRSYHVKFAPPKSMKKGSDGKPVPSSMTDNETGEALMQRPDDTSEALVKRLQGYHGETKPILAHYAPHGIVRSANANQSMDGVWKEVLDALKRSA